MPSQRQRYNRLHPPFYLAFGFLITILIGTVLLMSPISSAAGVVTPFIDAMFTATSATCVTGLVVHNTASYWSVFGQTVILILIQIGGLGFMTMTVLISMLLHRKITLSDRLVIKEQFGQKSIQGMVQWIRNIVIISFAIEFAGAVALCAQLIPRFGWRRGIWYSVFHSISAFCNAGFDVFGDSLESFQLNPAVLLTISALIIGGGLGFGVYLDIFNKNRRHLSLHTKLVLSMTALLLVLGTILFFMIEESNPATMRDMPLWGKWLAAFFQSVTARTAGYTSLVQSGLHEISAVLTIVLMFIGGGPAGMAGGIKTTTIAVLLLATRAQIRGESSIQVFHRRISFDIVMRSLTIIMVALLWVVMVSFVIAILEQTNYIVSLFETVSAFGTVGLTRDFTPGLSVISKMLLLITMYAGRVGPVTLAFALINRKKRVDYSYAEGNVMVG